MVFLRWNGPRSTFVHAIPSVFFGLILVFGVAVRFYGLGERSLWGDEFCTWKVAQMPMVESLRWQPELTKPPLYQLAVRGVARLFAKQDGAKVHQDAPYESGSRVQEFKSSRVPSEWHLRLPAAVCGTLTVVAMWWLGSMAGGWSLGAAGALLFAVNALQIDYSQEARPYSMLVLGSMVSTWIWYRLLTRQQGSEAARQRGNETTEEFRKRRISWLAMAYIFVAAITFHANYLMALTVAAQVIWAAISLVSIENRKSKIDNSLVPLAALFGAMILCVPMVWHFLRHRTSVFQGLDWIAAPTVGSAIRVLGEITFGPVWVWALLVPSVVVLVAAGTRKRRHPETPKQDGEIQIFSRQVEITTSPHHQIATSPNSDFFWLLVIWLIVAWGGLLVISWVAHPAMVARYALPAAAPAMLLPLIVLHRLDRRLPLLIAGVFVVGMAPAWATRTDRVKPGFREMVQFLDEYAGPQREAVVVAIERTTSPGWEEMDLLGFEYYGNSKFEIRSSKNDREAATTSPLQAPVEVLYLRNGRPDGEQAILRDPRALWMVTFLADPMKALKSAGRRIEQIEIEDKVFDQLYFEPYRLIRVAEMK